MLSPTFILTFGAATLATDLPPLPSDQAAKWILGVLVAVTLPAGFAAWKLVGYIRREYIPRWVYEDSQKRIVILESDIRSTNETAKKLADCMAGLVENEKTVVAATDGIADILRQIELRTGDDTVADGAKQTNNSSPPIRRRREQ